MQPSDVRGTRGPTEVDRPTTPTDGSSRRSQSLTRIGDAPQANNVAEHIAMVGLPGVYGTPGMDLSFLSSLQVKRSPIKEAKVSGATELMKTVSSERLRDIINHALEGDFQTYQKVSEACAKIALHRKIQYGSESTHRQLEDIYNRTITEKEAIRYTEILLEAGYGETIRSGELPTNNAPPVSTSNRDTQPEAGPSTGNVERAGSHLTEKARQGLTDFMTYADARAIPEEVVLAHKPQQGRHYLTATAFKDLVEHWNEPRELKQLKGFMVNLLQNKGKFSEDTIDMLRSGESRLTKNEVKALQYMMTLALHHLNLDKHAKQPYWTSIHNYARYRKES